MSLTTTLLLLAASAGTPPDPADFVVGAGETIYYDTGSGPLRVRDLVIEAGGTLRVQGREPLRVRARRSVRVDGTLDVSGFDAKDVLTLNTGNQPERGGAGGPGGGAGGGASSNTTDSTPAGGTGVDADARPLGGAGGESGYAPGVLDHRRPGGGGGGVLGPDAPADGAFAQDGDDGHPSSNGAQSGVPPARGGASGVALFVDGDPTNDFSGAKPDGMGGVIRGELAAPLGGRGGGGGGDAVPSATFPHPSWSPASDEKGGGGGGGGGLAFVRSPSIVIGPEGLVVADGGGGARGENGLFLDSIGGNGGGGSGGMLVLEARVIDLRQVVGRDALQALGGRGAVNLGTGSSWSAGGDGGPGLIQLHTPGAAGILLPPATRLSDLSAPAAHALLSR